LDTNFSITKRNRFYLKAKSVPTSKHSASLLQKKTNQLMLYSAKVTVCSEKQTKHINTECRISGC